MSSSSRDSKYGMVPSKTNTKTTAKIGWPPSTSVSVSHQSSSVSKQYVSTSSSSSSTTTKYLQSKSIANGNSSSIWNPTGTSFSSSSSNKQTNTATHQYYESAYKSGPNGAFVSSINKTAIDATMYDPAALYKSPATTSSLLSPSRNRVVEGTKYMPQTSGTSLTVGNGYVSPYHGGAIDPKRWGDPKSSAYKPTAMTAIDKQLTAATVIGGPIVAAATKQPASGFANSGAAAGNRATTTTVTHPTASSISGTKGLKQGYFYMFNQEEFQDKRMNREGSRRDEAALCKTFYNFGFDPKFKRNLKVRDIQAKAKELSRKDFRNYSCIVIVVLSHGTNDETIHAYDHSYNLNDTLVMPIASNSTLVGKPKIFIIAACKGSSTVEVLVKDAVPFADPPKTDVPYVRDILKCYSTFEGFVSFRNPEKGTLFIQKLCEILDRDGLTMSIEDVLKEVNRNLTEGPNKNKQVPTVVSTMSNNFCFGYIKRK